MKNVKLHWFKDILKALNFQENFSKMNFFQKIINFSLKYWSLEELDLIKLNIFQRPFKQDLICWNPLKNNKVMVNLTKISISRNFQRCHISTANRDLTKIRILTKFDHEPWFSNFTNFFDKWIYHSNLTLKHWNLWEFDLSKLIFFQRPFQWDLKC